MELSHAYFQAACAIMETILVKERDRIMAAAAILADQIAKGNLIHVFGSGGHSMMGAEEMFYRAGGLVPINPIFETGISLLFGARRSTAVERLPGFMVGVLKTYNLKAGEAMIIVNAYGINSASIDAALEAKKIGLATIAVTSSEIATGLPLDHPSRHPSGKNLHEVVDLFIDTHIPMGDAVVEIRSFPQKVAAISTIANTFALECLVAETIAQLVDRGVDPPIWKSANSPGGDEHNRRYLEAYAPRIRHL